MQSAGLPIPKPSGFIFEEVPVERDLAGNIIYPESDGQPVANNTAHLEWIVYLFDGLRDAFRNTEQVLVASDLFWYPVEGNPSIRVAPDVMVVFGVPKGRRGSFRQWDEGGIAPQVVFEILSPGNTAQEMLTKQAFFSAYGVEEYFVYDCEANHLQIWLRSGPDSGLNPVPGEAVEGWRSPRLGVRFWVHRDNGLTVELPSGKAIQTYAEIVDQRAQAESARIQAESARAQAEADRERLAAKLRELGIDPEHV